MALWSEKAPPTKDAILARFRAQGLLPYQWSNGPHYVYPDHSHIYHKVIYAVRGSIRWTLPETGQSFDMKAGDRLDLPSGTVHGAIVGPEGVVCLEAHCEP